MLNRRKYLLKKERISHGGHHILEIKALNKKVKAFYLEKIKLAVRGAVNCALGGIWGGVRVAKDLIPNAIPDSLTLNGITVKIKGMSLYRMRQLAVSLVLT